MVCRFATMVLVHVLPAVDYVVQDYYSIVKTYLLRNYYNFVILCNCACANR